MSNDTIPAIALGYLIIATVYVFWFGLRNVAVLIDSSDTAAFAAVIWLLSFSIVVHWCRGKTQ